MTLKGEHGDTKQGEEWPIPEKVKARIQAMIDTFNNQMGAYLDGVKTTLDIPDAAQPDLNRWVFAVPPDPGKPPPEALPPANRAERRRAAALATKAPPEPATAPPVGTNGDGGINGP